MAHTPLKMTVAEVQDEVRKAWTDSYSPEETRRALHSIADEPVPYKINILVSRIFFRGIYFPPRTLWKWLMLLAKNRHAIYGIVRDSFRQWNGAPGVARPLSFAGKHYEPMADASTQPDASTQV